MSNLNQFLSGVTSRSPTSLVNYISTNGWSSTAIVTTRADVKAILSGALTANTLATLLTVTGGGVVNLLTIKTVDATARTLRIQVIIDGATVLDSTSASISIGDQGGIAIGGVVGTGYQSSDEVPFNTSFVVKVASSLTETDKIAIGVKYRTV